MVCHSPSFRIGQELTGIKRDQYTGLHVFVDQHVLEVTPQDKAKLVRDRCSVVLTQDRKNFPIVG